MAHIPGTIKFKKQQVQIDGLADAEHKKAGRTTLQSNKAIQDQTTMPAPQQMSRSNTQIGGAPQIDHNMPASPLKGDKMLALQQLPQQINQQPIRGTVSTDANPGYSRHIGAQSLIAPISPHSKQNNQNFGQARQEVSGNINESNQKMVPGSHYGLRKGQKTNTVNVGEITRTTGYRDKTDARRAPSHEIQPQGEPVSGHFVKNQN